MEEFGGAGFFKENNYVALVHPAAVIGEGAVIWQLSQVREGAVVGNCCSIGRGVYIGPGVIIGSNCRIQNNALIYEPAQIAAGVFVGPNVIFTNDKHPRAVNLDGTPKSSGDWNPVGVTVGEGASIGAHATCVAPVHIGEWAVVAAGSVVVEDVPSYALVAGVPSRKVGWVGRGGRRLELRGERYVCPDTGEVFKEVDGVLEQTG